MISTLASESLELCQIVSEVELRTEDGPEWRQDNDLDFPLSKSVTCLTVIHR